MEKPDILLIFTDPRFFQWLFEMEDEIHQVCPIAYWHVWDNGPWPEFNRTVYEATDLVNCHSHMTYNLIREKFPEKTNFIPHALPIDLFKKLPDQEISYYKKMLLGEERKDHFTGIWVNRNAKRKRPNDVLACWKDFLDRLQEDAGHQKATLIMHTDPLDQEGPNLYETVEMLGINKNIFFSTDRLEFEKMNILHNISDFCINISLNEGFGLTTLESMQCGNPIIAPRTGGLTRQVVDHRDQSENGIALPIEVRSLVGSQLVPYIYEDYVSNSTTTKAIFDLYKMGPEARRELGEKARQYAVSEFSLSNVIQQWDESLWDLSERWNSSKDSIYQPYSVRTL
jgi:glycosyltransferase involved in cell wall biosynthesis